VKDIATALLLEAEALGKCDTADFEQKLLRVFTPEEWQGLNIENVAQSFSACIEPSAKRSKRDAKEDNETWEINMEKVERITAKQYAPNTSASAAASSPLGVLQTSQRE